MIIRVASPQDAATLRAIYAPYVQNTAITFEYQVPTVDEFARRIRTTLEKYPYLVAEENGQTLGYAYASAYKGRAAYDWAVEVSIYVQQGCHGRGIGKRLYQQLEQSLMNQHVRLAAACITWPNDESVRFHEACGYMLCAHFHQIGWKMNAWRDVVWMEKTLLSQTPPLPFIPFPDIHAEEVLP